MSTDLETPLKLLTVGMTTVFLILLIVVLSSKLLIYLVNRSEPDTSTNSSKLAPVIPKDIELVIGKAIHQITGGKAKIENIQKID